MPRESKAFVLDASAILAALQGERGHERVEAVLNESCVSAVNLAEVFTKLVDRGVTDVDARALVEALALDVYPFDVRAALSVGLLRRGVSARIELLR